MITYVKMDIFESPAQVIVNTVNTVGVMGKGIAKTYKKLYPEMFKQYQKFCEKGLLNIGNLWIYKSDNKWILNFPTKKHWRNPSKLEYIELGLKKFVDTYEEKGIRSISFPPLGCGNGGLNWERDVKPLMERYLSNLNIDVYIHVPLKINKTKKAEHKNIEETKRWINSQPTSLSFIVVWDDLKRALKNNNKIHSFYCEIVNEELDEVVIFYHDDEIVNKIPKGDFYESWNLLKQQELITEFKMASHLKENSNYIFELLSQLSYIEKVTILKKTDNTEVERIGIRLNEVDNEVNQGVLFV